ncbi:BZ3500_MvSof-1268-A1-R1_Chr2-1g04558 [Microbotryum saponariae]|uniref:BZ3500_MvSof-1268-A1-R1_Chr2-1g04558 protein n=1 Tax=Microbotryum saponariae TaxID=289078 RepID=A0A2X0MCX6_9BASI|nr:BZ3500_MvSof-1268-A1-R1_Chr2-1g04558 [Microbotryum saponariae]SCZ92020.1 BZ3501_MvSof-1269-A2-R1_Chr2-1g04214 [Microbotryum saponariae]
MNLRSLASLPHTSYAQKCGLQLFAVVSSDLPELNKERFMVASPGGLAFAYRQDWGDNLRDFSPEDRAFIRHHQDLRMPRTFPSCT